MGGAGGVFSRSGGLRGLLAFAAEVLGGVTDAVGLFPHRSCEEPVEKRLPTSGGEAPAACVEVQGTAEAAAVLDFFLRGVLSGFPR